MTVQSRSEFFSGFIGTVPVSAAHAGAAHPDFSSSAGPAFNPGFRIDDCRNGIGNYPATSDRRLGAGGRTSVCGDGKTEQMNTLVSNSARDLKRGLGEAIGRIERAFSKSARCKGCGKAFQGSSRTGSAPLNATDQRERSKVAGVLRLESDLRTDRRRSWARRCGLRGRKISPATNGQDAARKKEAS